MKADKDHQQAKGLTRRGFLGEASCAAIGSSSVLASMLNLKLAGRLAASDLPEGDDYKALVCIYLQGGNDSFNMLVPRGDTEYDEYLGVRRNLALTKESLLEINPATSDGRSFGLHRNCSNLQTMFEADELAFIANVGTLVEPTTKASYNGGLGNVPEGLFSHADQERQWSTAIPDRSAISGWAGRMTDLLISLNGEGDFATAISMSGVNLLQSGESTFPYAINESGSRGIDDWDAFGWRHGRAAVDSQLALEYSNVFQKTYVEKKKRAIELHDRFTTAMDTAAIPSVSIGSDDFSNQLEMVYRTIAAHESFGVRRQTFFVLLGGWDHHTVLDAPHAGLLARINHSLSRFNTLLKDAGLSDCVTTFSASDFGRSLTSNGDGSDHGWGGNQFVFGGAVNGGDIYGSYPELYIDNPLDVGRGRFIPTTSVDEYFAELACWFGVSPSQLPLVLPHLDRFYDVDSGSPPLGFMDLPA